MTRPRRASRPRLRIRSICAGWLVGDGTEAGRLVAERLRPHWLVALFASLSVTAQAQPPTSVRRDSGGATNVEVRNTRTGAPRLRLTERPSLVLGGERLNEAETFDARHPYLSAVELKGGTIVVNDLVSLKFFSRSGVLQRVVGRRGTGPGEFQQVREICRFTGDSLLVIDAASGRLTLWDSAGRHVATHERFAYVPSGACTPRGTVIARSAGGAPGSRHGRSYAPFAEYRPDGTRLRSVGLLPAPQPSGPIIQDVHIATVGDGLWVGDPEAGELWIQQRPGVTSIIVRMLDPRSALTDDRWREEIEAMFPKTLARAQRERAVERVAKLRRPAFDPAFLDMRVDPDGRTWINDYRDRTRWTVFDARGALLGQLLLSSTGGAASPLLAGVFAGGRVVLLARSPDGFPELRIHAVEMPRGGATIVAPRP